MKNLIRGREECTLTGRVLGRCCCLQPSSAACEGLPWQAPFPVPAALEQGVGSPSPAWLPTAHPPWSRENQRVPACC